MEGMREETTNGSKTRLRNLAPVSQRKEYVLLCKLAPNATSSGKV